MTHETRINLTRWGVVLGVLVALVALTTAAKNVLDDRYVTRAELEQIKGDIRVIRCAVVKDCR